MDGILLLNKPIAWTSHDLVDAVRRKIGQRAVGHAGTLDPMATGLMILLLGKSTKRSAEFMGHDKSYRGSIRLGTVTDSWDLDGKVLDVRPVPELRPQEITDVFEAIAQERSLMPPAFSAIKTGGRKAYQAARAGESVVVASRAVTIHRLEMDAYDPPEIYFTVDCSKGTYVRSIAHETGLRLGCGAALSSLVRTRIGDMALSDALTIDRFQKMSPREIEKSHEGL